MSKSASVMIDLEDRDPNTLSQHLQVLWDDIIGEPDSIRSPECVWRLSQQCYKHSRNCCYIFLTVLLAPFTAVCLGFSFACLAFQHIWCLTPCLRVWKITFATVKKFVLVCAHAIVVPCTDAFGYIWSNIKVTTQQLSNGPDRKEDPLLI